jgi:hypothetical protein
MTLSVQCMIDVNATGCSLGTTFASNRMDWPMFYAGDPVEAQPDMVSSTTSYGWTVRTVLPSASVGLYG